MAKNKKRTEKGEISEQRVNPLILVFLLLSGSCGLIYEIVWMKMLTLVIGNTVFAITTVLAAFMGGLALGSHLAGRLEDRIRQPLKTYGLLEGGIGVYALLLPVLIAGTEPFFRIVYQNIGTSFYIFILLRFVICGILLLVPTILMGATLPVLSKYFVANPSHIGGAVGLLYGVNTLGAVLGSFAAGFVLIPALGISLTIYTAALTNILIAAAIFWLFKDSGLPELPVSKNQVSADKQKQKAVEEIIPENQRAAARVVMAAIGISGLAAMIYQIAWTRVLLLSMGSSVYAFSLIVTAFISGLALGSLAITRFIDRAKDGVLILALLQGAIGLSALTILQMLGNLPIFVAQFLFDSPRSFQYIQLVEFAVIFGLILTPTLMMGATVPVAVKICTKNVRQVGKFFGNVYAINTLGAIIGSFAAGFILIPWLGARNSLLIAVTMNILTAGILFLRASTPALSRRVAGAVATALIALVIWYPLTAWNAAILTSGPYLYTDRYREVSATKKINLRVAMQEGRQPLFFKEGLHAVVAVEKTIEGDRTLRVNGKNDASAKSDAATQLMCGHLPLLLHQDTKDVLVIGLGSGMTIGAVQRYAVKTVDVVEIEPAVVEASRYFKDFTGDPLNDPRVNLIVADGRNHLAFTSRQYDVIISEPSNPWVSGQANLFTRESFELAKKHLKKGGVMCQWVQAYSMSAVDFQTIVHTFNTIFPHVTVWEASFGGDYLLIGAQQDFKVDYAMFRDHLGEESMRADLTRTRTRNLVTFLDKLVMADEAVARYTQGAPLHTDDNARLEYSAPKALLQGRSTFLMEGLYRFRPQPADMMKLFKGIENLALIEKDLSAMSQAKKLTVGGFTSYAKGAIQEAINKFEDALALHPKNYDAAYLLAKLTYLVGSQYKKNRRLAEATGAYEKCIKVINNFMAEDRALLSEQFELEVIYAKAHLDLGVMALNAKRLKQAAAAFEKSLSGEVHLAEAHNNLGVVYARLGQNDAAATHYQSALELSPHLVSARMNFGNLLLHQKKYREAIANYIQVKKLRPDFAVTNYNLGMAYFMLNQWEKAEAQWERALALQPDLTQARQSLKVVRKKMKSP